MKSRAKNIGGVREAISLTVIVGRTKNMFLDVFILIGLRFVFHPRSDGKGRRQTMIQHVVRYSYRRIRAVELEHLIRFVSFVRSQSFRPFGTGYAGSW